MEPEIIAKEYSLTDQGLKAMKPIFKERLLKHPALAGNEKGVENMSSSRAESMLASIQMLQEIYGSAEGYVTQHLGFSESEMKQLKKNLISNTPPIL